MLINFFLIKVIAAEQTARGWEHSVQEKSASGRLLSVPVRAEKVPQRPKWTHRNFYSIKDQLFAESLSVQQENECE